jgi:hypothetical protein
VRIRPRDWSEFQHYKNRSPIWIKLHRSLLDDFEFQCLAVEARALAPMLWLLASEDKGGVIDATPARLGFRLRMNPAEVERALAPLVAGGFFEEVQDACTPLAEAAPDSSPEKEEKREEQTRSSDPPPADADIMDLNGSRSKKSYPEDFEAFWKAYPTDPIMSKSKAFEKWQRLNAPDRAAAAAAIRAFRKHCAQNPTYRPVHAERFLSQRRFDGLTATAPADEAGATAAWDGRAAPLVAEIGAAKFLAWFGEADFAPGPPAIITVKRAFQKQWIQNNYEAPLRRVFGDYELRAA